MRRKLDSRLVVAVYAWCRQAERSLDHTLVSPDLWLPFTRYYDHRKRKGLCAVVEQLRAGSETLTLSPSREQLFEISLAGKIRSFCDRSMNRFRSHWCFARQELAFFAQTLNKFVKLLDEREPPPLGTAVAMRMDLYACQWAIGNRVGTTPALTKAARVENFGQPAFLEHVSLEELGLIPAEQRLAVSAG